MEEIEISEHETLTDQADIILKKKYLDTSG